MNIEGYLNFLVIWKFCMCVKGGGGLMRRFLIVCKVVVGYFVLEVKICKC